MFSGTVSATGMSVLRESVSTTSFRRFLGSFRTMLNADLGIGITLANICMALIAVGVLWCVDLLQEKHHLREELSQKKLWLRWIIIFAGLFAVIIFGTYGPGFDAKSFIYEQF